MMNYKTPGVYVEELSLLPPSIVQVATAIPAFIGYTEIAFDSSGDKLVNIPCKVASLLEYEELFGGPENQNFTVTLEDTEPYMPISVDFTEPEVNRKYYRMYHAIRQYFDNGGGPCYIISVGTFGKKEVDNILDDSNDYQELKAGLDAARKIDEITLILFPEADQLSGTARFDLYKDTLLQCATLQDRFGIFDVMDNDSEGDNFRNNIGTNNLSYGAAYYPFLNTNIPEPFTSETIDFKQETSSIFNGLQLDQVEWLSEALQINELIKEAKANAQKAKDDSDNLGSENRPEKLRLHKLALEAALKAHNNAVKAKNNIKYIDIPAGALKDKIDNLESANTKIEANDAVSGSTIAEIETAIENLLESIVDSETSVTGVIEHINDETSIAQGQNDDILKFFTNSLMSEVIKLLADLKVKMPPSSAIAGVYAQTDRNRGVWKSPANVSLNGVIGPSVKIDNNANDNFNVHATGKSINVIRAFTGKGTLVWGARTLDGNSSEWKYVSVRRFYNMVEESVKEASEQFVFEPNNANTWVKVKGMIENFLLLQWRAGALMGSKPEQAFFVKIGLGQTMTQDDVLNGKMIVEIGLAVVRPAEFIILRFSHKMLEA